MLNDTLGHKCVLMVSYVSDNQGLYILGDTFLRSFYTTFNFKLNQLQMAVSAKAPEGTLIKQMIPGWVCFMYFLAVVIGVSLLCAAGCQIRKRSCRPRVRQPEIDVESTDSIRDLTEDNRITISQPIF